MRTHEYSQDLNLQVTAPDAASMCNNYTAVIGCLPLVLLAGQPAHLHSSHLCDTLPQVLQLGNLLLPQLTGSLNTQNKALCISVRF